MIVGRGTTVYTAKGPFRRLPGEAVVHRDTLPSCFHKHLEAAGLPVQPFHNLRHASASFLLARAAHPRVVSETLGHSQIGLTMNVYSHVLPSLERDAADRMDALLSAN